MTRYAEFTILRNMTKLTKTERGYSKFIQTGQLEICDYGVGFIDLSLYAFNHFSEGWSVRLWFGTIDDGDFGAWKKVDSKETAEKLVEAIAQEVFKDMVSFPTIQTLNEILEPYSVSVGYE